MISENASDQGWVLSEPSEVGTVELAAIKVQPFPQQPESSPINMAKTRLQTARSHSTNPTTLPTLQEDFGNLDMGDEGETVPQGPPQPASQDNDAEVERREAEGIDMCTTPRSRKIATSHSIQKDLVLHADLNYGRCLITNLLSPTTVQACHLVAQATRTQTVRVSVLHTRYLNSLNPTCRS